MALINRTQAGQLLAKKLTPYTNCPDGLVLALPRGGVPVGFEIAQTLNLPLDICLVRKLGVPRHPELAMGAIAMGGILVINEEIVESMNISQQVITKVIEQEKQELERRNRIYREHLPLPHIQDQTIILVDDGIATGATLRAALVALKQEKPKDLIIAVPVVPPSTYTELKQEVNQIVCLLTPEPFNSISLWYEDFSQTSDEEVRYFLGKSQQQQRFVSIK